MIGDTCDGGIGDSPVVATKTLHWPERFQVFVMNYLIVMTSPRD